MTMLGKIFGDDFMLTYGVIVIGLALVLGILRSLRAKRRKFRRPCARRILAFDAHGNRTEFILRDRSSD